MHSGDGGNPSGCSLRVPQPPQQFQHAGIRHRKPGRAALFRAPAPGPGLTVLNPSSTPFWVGKQFNPLTPPFPHLHNRDDDQAHLVGWDARCLQSLGSSTGYDRHYSRRAPPAPPHPGAQGQPRKPLDLHTHVHTLSRTTCPRQSPPGAKMLGLLNDSPPAGMHFLEQVTTGSPGGAPSLVEMRRHRS